MSSLGQPPETSQKSLGWLGLFFFLAALVLYARHADFPSYYHADEPSKVDQLLKEYRNFKHPLLMLNTAEAVAEIIQTPRENEALVRVGRFLSALYGAGIVALMAVLAANTRNLLTGIAVGLLCLCLTPLYEAAHYFKEDSLFLFMGLLTLTLIVFHRDKTHHLPIGRSAWLWPIAMGICTGLLVCSRYFTLLLIPLIFWGSGFHSGRKASFKFFGSLTLTILLVHLPSLHWLPYFLEEFPLEAHYMVAGHYGVGLPVPHAEYFKYWTGETNPALWFFLTLFLVFQIRERKSGVWIAFVLLLLYMLVLSCLPKYSERYLLPVLLGTLFFAARGADTLAHCVPQKFVQFLIWLFSLGLFLFFSLPGLLQMENAFRQDSRAELAAWVRQNLPLGSKLAQDDLVRIEVMTGKDYPSSSAEFVPDLGTISELQKKGIHYVAICRRTHFPYTEPGLLAAGSNSSEFIRRREFYLALIQKGKILWEAPDRNPKILHPGIALYDISNIRTP